MSVRAVLACVCVRIELRVVFQRADGAAPSAVVCDRNVTICAVCLWIVCTACAWICVERLILMMCGGCFMLYT